MQYNTQHMKIIPITRVHAKQFQTCTYSMTDGAMAEEMH